MMIKHNIKLYSWITCAVLSFYAITHAHAAPGTLADSPLFASTNVSPNVFFELDDSGSMDWEILTQKYWHPCSYDRDNNGNTGNADCGFLIDGIDGLFRTWSGTSFRNYAYVFSNIDNLYGVGCDASFPKLEACSAAVQAYDWRVRSSALNILYYNPDITYLPWLRGDSPALANASFTAARSNPQSGESGYTAIRDLTGFSFEIWTDSHGFNATDARPRRGTNINRTAGSNGFVDLWDEHTRYTVNASDMTVDTITYAPIAIMGALNPSVASSTIATGLNTRTLAAEKQNIANWYQYHRRRAFVAKAALAKVISDNPDFRYGLNTINNTMFTEFPTVSSGFSTHNTTLLDDLFSLNWPALGTPLQRGLERAGNYLDNTDGRTDPIIHECQQNFTVLFTDGYWNGLPPAAAIGDADGDGHSLTLADVARFYYNNDLSALPNNVPTNLFDSATYQHMVTFSVAFGLSGFLTDTDNDGWPGTAPGLAENGNWGDPFNSNPEKIDDLWHAAFNAKGTFVSASTPKAVSDTLSNALSVIGDRVGSAAKVSFNTSSLASSSAVYLAQFNNSNARWSGDLLSFALNPANGNVATAPSWSAADLLDVRALPVTSRAIITYDRSGTGTGIPFQWANLTLAQQADLKTEPNATVGADAKAQARLDFIRGDRSNEQGKGGAYTFRSRRKLLGDIVDSAPVFVGRPDSSWPNTAPFPTAAGQKYSDFAAANFGRTEILYTGANDGMLHGFNASDGAETLAYIPGNLFSSVDATSGLHYLTDPAYTHRYYVNMPSTVEDAFFNTGSGAAWHTVLIGGERGGGKGIFALDVTNPASLTEANAAQVALWEFDNSDDPDMGYSYSQPTIAMMPNGRWAAIFGNGYNSDSSGQAFLFVLFLDGGLDGVWTLGTDYIKIPTGVGSIVSGDCANGSSDCNGLSSPQVADSDNNFIVDRVYAGDLKGNMWAFDLSNANPNLWAVAYPANPPAYPSGSPLFIAGKPITSKPSLIRHPAQPTGAAPNVLVYFGTGQYLVTGDVATTDVQAFYGVWDHGVSSITSASLVEQTFLPGLFTNSGDSGGPAVDVSSQFSVLTNNPVDYSTKQGWFIQLTENVKERVIVDSAVRGKLLFFNTWIPDNTPCGSGGSGVLMSVNPVTGGRPDTAGFDLTGNNTINNDDLVSDGSGANFAATGQKFNLGLPGESGFMDDYQYTGGTGTGTVDKRRVGGGGNPPGGGGGGGGGSGLNRFSWQELRN